MIRICEVHIVFIVAVPVSPPVEAMLFPDLNYFVSDGEVVAAWIVATPSISCGVVIWININSDAVGVLRHAPGSAFR